jgi:hypothetical protein
MPNALIGIYKWYKVPFSSVSSMRTPIKFNKAELTGSEDTL